MASGMDTTAMIKWSSWSSVAMEMVVVSNIELMNAVVPSRMVVAAKKGLSINEQIKYTINL